jgi:formate/nitrite transporter FocA (FNT family)
MKKLHLQEISKTDIAVFVLLAVCSGLMIGIGGTASLLAQSLYASWGKLIGAILFSLGIFAIVTFEMKLFTGMVADIPTMPRKNLWMLPTCFIGNAIGVALIALLVSVSPVADATMPLGKEIIAAKLGAENWALRSLSSSIFCGMLITLSVWSVKYAPKKGLSATVGLTFPIIVFAFCGFDHSVANMLYFYYFGEVSLRVVGYIALSILGNIIGGVILPLVVKLRTYSINRKQPQTENAKEE